MTGKPIRSHVPERGWAKTKEPSPTRRRRCARWWRDRSGRSRARRPRHLELAQFAPRRDHRARRLGEPARLRFQSRRAQELIFYYGAHLGSGVGTAAGASSRGQTPGDLPWSATAPSSSAQPRSGTWLVSACLSSRSCITTMPTAARTAASSRRCRAGAWCRPGTLPRLPREP